MAIKKDKISDGFFVWEQTTYSLDDPESIQAFDDVFCNMRNIESELNDVEKRIHKLQETPQEKAGKQNPKLQKHHDKYKELNQVESYADNALWHLKQARENLAKRDTEQAMVDTIYMMNAYWSGFIHTEGIKSSILRDKVHTAPKKAAGKITGQKKADAAKPEHDRIILLSKSIPAGKSASNIARILKDKHGVKLSSRQIGTILKQDQDSEKAP